MTAIRELPQNTAHGIEFVKAGRLIARTVERSKRRGFQGDVLFDMDGVLYDGTDFLRPHPTPITAHTVPGLLSLVDAGARIGLATSRGKAAGDWLEEMEGIPLGGPKILSAGEHTIIGGIDRHAGPAGFTRFIHGVRSELPYTTFYSPDWPTAFEFPKNEDGSVNVALGNPQWGSDTVTYLWFRDIGETEDVMAAQLHPFLNQTAARHGLVYERDVSVRATHQPVNEVVMVGVKAALEGRSLSKGNAAYLLDPSVVFVADGPGDLSLARAVRRDGGTVIGIGGSPDLTTEIEEFYRVANVVLPGPEDLPPALEYAAYLLTSNGRRTFV